MGFKKSHVYTVLAKKSKFESIITHWTRIINKSLEIYENEVEKDTFEKNLQKKDIFCDKCFKTILWVKTLAQVCRQKMRTFWFHI